MKICLVKRDKPVLEPAYPSDLKIVQRLRPNIVKSVDLTQPRNPDFHKKLFAICRETVRQAPEGSVWEGKTSYLLLKAIMFELGLVDTYLDINGGIHLKPKSVAFDNMDNIEFEDVFRRVVSVCANILGCTFEELNKRSKFLEL